MVQMQMLSLLIMVRGWTRRAEMGALVEERGDGGGCTGGNDGGHWRRLEGTGGGCGCEDDMCANVNGCSWLLCGMHLNKYNSC